MDFQPQRSGRHWFRRDFDGVLSALPENEEGRWEMGRASTKLQASGSRAISNSKHQSDQRRPKRGRGKKAKLRRPLGGPPGWAIFFFAEVPPIPPCGARSRAWRSLRPPCSCGLCPYCLLSADSAQPVGGFSLSPCKGERAGESGPVLFDILPSL